jgi:hypothetical protein
MSIYPVNLPQLILLSIGSATVGGAIGLVNKRSLRWLLLGCTCIVIYTSAGLALSSGIWLPVGIQFLSLTGASLLVFGTRSISPPTKIQVTRDGSAND